MSATRQSELITKSYRCKAKACGCAFDHTVLRSEFLDDVVTCPRCKGTRVREFVPLPAFDHKTQERSGRQSARGITAPTLPLNMPGADAYTKEGYPQFESRQKYQYAAQTFYGGKVISR